jgi:hypothetical protein
MEEIALEKIFLEIAWNMLEVVDAFKKVRLKNLLLKFTVLSVKKQTQKLVNMSTN